jgi:hypothetical protein
VTYIVHTLIQESPAHTVGPVLDPESSDQVHDSAGLTTLAENASRRAEANLHFEALDQRDADNWRRTFEGVSSLTQFNDQRLAAPIVAELARVRSEKLFDRIQVWSRYPWNSPSQEVVFVGIIGKYPKPTDYYIIAQWSPNEDDVLTTSEMLRLRHKAHTNPLVALSIMPRLAKIVFAISLTLFAIASLYTDWRFALACMAISGVGWVGGKPLAKGDDEIAELIYIGMGCLGIASVVLTVVFGAAA